MPSALGPQVPLRQGVILSPGPLNCNRISYYPAIPPCQECCSRSPLSASRSRRHLEDRNGSAFSRSEVVAAGSSGPGQGRGQRFKTPNVAKGQEALAFPVRSVGPTQGWFGLGQGARHHGADHPGLPDQEGVWRAWFRIGPFQVTLRTLDGPARRQACPCLASLAYGSNPGRSACSRAIPASGHAPLPSATPTGSSPHARAARSAGNDDGSRRIVIALVQTQTRSFQVVFGGE